MNFTDLNNFTLAELNIITLNENVTVFKSTHIIPCILFHDNKCILVIRNIGLCVYVCMSVVCDNLSLVQQEERVHTIMYSYYAQMIILKNL